jgi:NADPH:quinone reductase-like Zn-dependent oxidoreductase
LFTRIHGRDRAEVQLKAIVATDYGPPEVLRLTEVAKPVPDGGELLVRVRATTVTRGDARIRSSTYAPWFQIPSRFMYGFRRPRKAVPGNEFAGVVEEVGQSVTRFDPGDEVFGVLWGTAFAGANAEFLCIGEDEMVAPKPVGVSHEEAAALPVGGLTALHFLRRAGLRSGQNILIVGGSGSVGTFAVQFAKHFGADVTAVCSTANVDLLKDLGADRVIDYTDEDFTRIDQTFDVVFDAVSKTSFSACRGLLTVDGVFATTDWPMHLALWTRMRGGRRVVIGIAKKDPADLRKLAELAEAGELRSVVGRSYRLEAAAEAHHLVDGGHKVGNVVLTLGQGDD